MKVYFIKLEKLSLVGLVCYVAVALTKKKKLVRMFIKVEIVNSVCFDVSLS